MIKTVLGLTGIADDALAKEDSEINHNIAVLSLGTAQNNNQNFNPGKIQDKGVQVL